MSTLLTDLSIVKSNEIACFESFEGNQNIAGVYAVHYISVLGSFGMVGCH